MTGAPVHMHTPRKTPGVVTLVNSATMQSLAPSTKRAFASSAMHAPTRTVYTSAGCTPASIAPSCARMASNAVAPCAFLLIPPKTCDRQTPSTTHYQRIWSVQRHSACSSKHLPRCSRPSTALQQAILQHAILHCKQSSRPVSLIQKQPSCDLLLHNNSRHIILCIINPCCQPGHHHDLGAFPSTRSMQRVGSECLRCKTRV